MKIYLDTSATNRIFDDQSQARIYLESASIMNIKGMDSLHLASAEKLGVDYFITCDDRMIKRYRGDMIVINPTAFANDAINRI